MPDHGDLAALGEALRADIFSLMGAPDEWRDLTDLGQEAAALWQAVDQQFGALATWLTSPLIDPGSAAGDFLAETTDFEAAPSSAPDRSLRPLVGSAADPSSAREDGKLGAREDGKPGAREALIPSASNSARQTPNPPPASPAETRRFLPQNEAEAARFAAPPSLSSREAAPRSRNLPVESLESDGFPRNSRGAGYGAEGRNTSPEPPIKRGSREAKRPFSTQNDLAETGGLRDEAPLVTYKPVRGLRDLAQVLGSQSYSEEQPLTSASGSPRAAGAQGYSSDQGEAVRQALAARRSNPSSAPLADGFENDVSEQGEAVRRTKNPPRSNPRESAAETDRWERSTGVIRPEPSAIEAAQPVRETASVSGSAEEPAAPDVDVEDLLNALSRSIVEEYHRFYRS